MLEPGLQESWLDGNSTDFASGLLNSGFCAALLAGLAASGIAQHYGIPHDDALAVHALQLAQVWHASAQDLNLFRDAHVPKRCSGPCLLRILLASTMCAARLLQETGAASADLAMADRLIEGRGIPQDCPAGMM